MIGVTFAALAVASLGTAFGYPAFRRLIAPCAPSARSLALLVYALMAPASTIVVLLMLFEPEYSALVVPSHCHGDDCASHAPLLRSGSVVGTVLAASASLLGGTALVAAVGGVRLGRRRLRALTAFGRLDDGREYFIVESPDLFAWCCGLCSTRIVVSRGLVARLTPAQLDVVVAHERAHADRLDNLRAAVATWSTLLWPAPARRCIRRDLADDSEKACDRAALRTARDPELFEAAVRAANLPDTRRAGARGVAFGSNVGNRIAASALDDRDFRGSARAWIALGILWFALIAVTTSASHLLLERITALG